MADDILVRKFSSHRSGLRRQLAMPEPSVLFAMLMFSIIGLLAFKRGKREVHLPHIIIGLVLMLYPYFVPAGLWLWAAGIVLTGLLFVLRE
jgi:hypothetical protein